MLHSVPALVDELEAKLVAGQDPLPLLASVDWRQLVGWPVNLEQARRLKQRVTAVLTLVRGLHAPVAATLAATSGAVTYRPGITGPYSPAAAESFHQEI